MSRTSLLLAGALVGALATHASGATSEIVVGNVRVQALSPTLIRIEPKGPMGFEDRTTMTVTNREGFASIPISTLNTTSDGTWLKTENYLVFLAQSSSLPDGTSCQAFQDGMAPHYPRNHPKYPDGITVADRGECCSACQKLTGDDNCKGYVYDSSADENGVNCWPLEGYASLEPAKDRQFGCNEAGCVSGVTEVTVTSLSGDVLWSQKGQPSSLGNLLHWPSPLNSSAYALTDYPRFFVPEWGPSPIPSDASVDPALLGTNGYDYRNNQNGDTYVFLLDDSLETWNSARAEFVQLVGGTPLLPDYAFGTWFTYWHYYTEAEAKDDVEHWKDLNLPIDIYGLDMNWRNTKNQMDRTYDHPNNDLFANFTEWFSYLEQNKLRTYFNDHPFPVDMQTSPREVAFRNEGLTEWMEKGLTFWWFDHNWGFSVPPPNLTPVEGWNVSRTDGIWDGLDNAAWGSHLYYSTVKNYQADKDVGRPISLTKFARPNSRPGAPSTTHMEHPSQHRYPVWWTGDGVDLQASVETMVDAGVHGFKPFVHSDCGGDYRGTEGDLLRWTAHCTFGSILRFHGSDHRSWTYDSHTVDVVRSYLNTRYKMMPSLIAGGAHATVTGFPLVARGDLFWPEHTEAASNQQYVFLNDTLIAPVFNTTANETEISVWVPPGDWHDAWDGSTVTGPKTIKVTQPFERQPMWHRAGGLVVVTDKPGLRVDEQDWSELTLEAFPTFTEHGDSHVERSVFSQGTSARTIINMKTSREGKVYVSISASDDGAPRSWVLRLHLRPGQLAESAVVDDQVASLSHVQPISSEQQHTFFPFGGTGSPSAPLAGPVVELRVSSAAHARVVHVQVQV